MTTSRLFEIPIGAWHSVPLYQEVAVRWKGLNALYLFLFLLVGWFPWVVKEQSELNRYAQEWVEPLIGEFPRFGISSGKLWVDGEPRRTISDPKTGRPLLLIDTTGQTLSLDGLSIPALVTADALIFRKEAVVEEKMEAVVEEKMSFSNLPNRSVTPQELRELAAHWIPSLLWYSYPLLLLGSFLFRSIQVILLSGVGLIVCSLLETDLTLPALIRVSVLAITPAMILRTLCNVFDIVIPFSGLLFTLITIGYLVFGISANRLAKSKGFRDSRSEW